MSIDLRDVVALVGLVMLFVGIWGWLHIYAALVVVGALFLVVSMHGITASKPRQ